MQNKTYAEKMRDLRPFVDFNYDLRKKLHPRQKGKINKYYKELSSFQGGLFRPYSTKNKKKLRRIQEATGMTLKGFKKAFIPDYHPTEKYTPVLLKNGQVTFSSKFETKTIYEVGDLRGKSDPEKEILKTLSSVRENKIGIICGEHEFKAPRLQNKDDARETTLYLINAYNGIKDDGSLANNNFRNWFTGFFGVTVKNQKKLDIAMQEKDSFAGLTRRQKVKKLKKKVKAKKNGKKKNSRRGL